MLFAPVSTIISFSLGLCHSQVHSPLSLSLPIPSSIPQLSNSEGGQGGGEDLKLGTLRHATAHENRNRAGEAGQACPRGRAGKQSRSSISLYLHRSLSYPSNDNIFVPHLHPWRKRKTFGHFCHFSFLRQTRQEHELLAQISLSSTYLCNFHLYLSCRYHPLSPPPPLLLRWWNDDVLQTCTHRK